MSKFLLSSFCVLRVGVSFFPCWLICCWIWNLYTLIHWFICQFYQLFSLCVAEWLLNFALVQYLENIVKSKWFYTPLHASSIFGQWDGILYCLVHSCWAWRICFSLGFVNGFAVFYIHLDSSPLTQFCQSILWALLLPEFCLGHLVHLVWPVGSSRVSGFHRIWEASA
jgi:hypothetical protein